MDKRHLCIKDSAKTSVTVTDASLVADDDIYTDVHRRSDRGIVRLLRVDSPEACCRIKHKMIRR